MSELSTSGGCMCGRVRYAITGEPFAINYCHCMSCRRHNGAPVVVLAGYLAAQVQFSGEDRGRYESSPDIFRGFCSNCGTPLTWEGDGGEELGPIIEVHVNTFAEPERMVPTSHAFEPKRIPWLQIKDDLPRYEGFSELSELLHHDPASNQAD